MTEEQKEFDYVDFFNNLPIKSLKGILKRYKSRDLPQEIEALNMLKSIIREKKRESKAKSTDDSLSI